MTGARGAVQPQIGQGRLGGLGAGWLALLAGLAATAGGLALSRVLYEWLFPLRWLGHPLALFVFGCVPGLAAALGTRRRLAKGREKSRTLLPFVPLLLNLVFLFDPTVNLAQSRLLFAASLWLAGYLGLVSPARRRWQLLWLWLGLASAYFATMPATVGRADTFEFQVVAPSLGIAHPTGYPLYLLLGKTFTLLPVGTVAWRLNMATMLFGLGALGGLFLLLDTLSGRRPLAFFGAAALGLTPTFWSQAIEAEVYTLHLLILAAALALMARWVTAPERLRAERGWLPALSALIGLGLTNHLTTVLLLPAAFLFLWFVRRQLPREGRFWLGMLLALFLPLTLYAYLPLRWAAVNGEPMGAGRFLDWVIGGRFQGALQLDAWLRDVTRYRVVGRLFAAEWGGLGLVWAGIGWIALATRRPRATLLLLITLAGFVFYALNYLVPDLAVFLLPAQFVVAVGWGAAPLWLGRQDGVPPGEGHRASLAALIGLVAIAVPLTAAAAEWASLDRSGDDALTVWGQAVLSLPLENGAAVLADSEKIAPLYYLQRAEGLRPDLDILVLPDEAAYRSELDRRLNAGQPVYLARFLPGLEGAYHLRSVGPLLRVSPVAATALPETVEPAALVIDGVVLSGFDVSPVSPFDPTRLALTLYWQTNDPLSWNRYVYLRWVWAGSRGTTVSDPVPETGQHPAGNNYPTVAWRPGEIVSDFHQLPRPRTAQADGMLTLEVALAPRYTPADALDWHAVTTLPVPAFGADLIETRPLRVATEGLYLTGADVPPTARPGSRLTLTLVGSGDSASLPPLELASVSEERPEVPATDLGSPAWLPDRDAREALLLALEVPIPAQTGTYQLVLGADGRGYGCGWARTLRSFCRLSEIIVSGPAIPADAANFADRFALVDIELPTMALTPGAQLPVELNWLALADVAENYTVFVQVLDEADRIVGQVDSWPLQGTFPTSQWEPGNQVVDPYLVQLDPELPAGAYRLIVGWYLLGTGERLAVLNEEGDPVADRVTVTGLHVSP